MDSASANSENEWDGWEEEDEPTRDLFSEIVFPSPKAALSHISVHHGFDISQKQMELGSSPI